MNCNNCDGCLEPVGYDGNHLHMVCSSCGDHVKTDDVDNMNSVLDHLPLELVARKPLEAVLPYHRLN